MSYSPCHRLGFLYLWAVAHAQLASAASSQALSRLQASGMGPGLQAQSLHQLVALQIKLVLRSTMAQVSENTLHTVFVKQFCFCLLGSRQVSWAWHARPAAALVSARSVPQVASCAHWVCLPTLMLHQHPECAKLLAYAQLGLLLWLRAEP